MCPEPEEAAVRHERMIVTTIARAQENRKYVRRLLARKAARICRAAGIG
jgi:ribosomal protein L17